jgi:hypothetical protein
VHCALVQVSGEKRGLRVSDFTFGHVFGRTVGHAIDVALSFGLAITAAGAGSCGMRGHESIGCGSHRGCSE